MKTDKPAVVKTDKTDLDEIQRMIVRFLEKHPEKNHLPKDITDQVFCAIESSAVYLTRYERLIGRNKEKREPVNQQIGKMVKVLTGLNVVGESAEPRSKLITSYSELG